jgi:FkbM family methyltransferase
MRFVVSLVAVVGTLGVPQTLLHAMNEPGSALENVDFPVYTSMKEASVDVLFNESTNKEVDLVSIGIDGYLAGWQFICPDPVRSTAPGANWYEKTMSDSPHRFPGQDVLENAITKLVPDGRCDGATGDWVVLNAGAHLGMWPGIAASRNCPAVSLEAMPWTIKYHLATRAVNGWQDLWQPLDGASGDKDGDTVDISNSGAGIEGAKLATEGAELYQVTTASDQVRMHTLDAVKKQFYPSALNVIAVIDVEGFEQETLVGMDNIIRGGQLKFANIEVWSSFPDGKRRDNYTGLSLLVDAGYKLCFNDQEITDVTPASVESLTFPICQQSLPGQKECLVDMEAWHPTYFTDCAAATKDRTVSSLAQPIDNQRMLAANSSSEVPIYVNTVPIFEYYNGAGMDHEYTTRSTPPPMWVNQGTAFKAFNQPVSSKLVKPIFQQHSGDDHLYSANATARDTDWNVDGVVFYAYASEVPGSVPIYEHYREVGQDHLYSLSNTAFDSGWIVKGVAFYAFPA